MRPGVRIATSTEGPGDRWLLLHGTPLTPRVWDGVWDGAVGHE